MVNERRRVSRRVFSYYMPVNEAASSKQFGILTDISSAGFKVDSQVCIPVGQVEHLRLIIPPEISSQASIVFSARCVWCHADEIEPSVFNIGFEVVALSRGDALIYQRVLDKYGSQKNNIEGFQDNYFWRS